MNSVEFVDNLEKKYLVKNYEKLPSVKASSPSIETKSLDILTKDCAMGGLWHAEDAASQDPRFKIEDDIKVASFEQSWEEGPLKGTAQLETTREKRTWEFR